MKKQISSRFFLLAVFLMVPTFTYAAPCLYYTPNEAYTPPTSSGTKYYVDGTNGSDTYNGLSAAYTSGTNGPWKTLAKAFDRYTNRGAGAQILIRAGHYYGKINVPGTPNWSYGSSEADRTVIAAYGDGEVIIDASITSNLGAWSQYAGDNTIYQSAFSVAPTGAGVMAVVIDDDFRTYHPVSSLAGVVKDGDWYYDGTIQTLYIKTPTSVGDPAGHSLYVLDDKTINDSTNTMMLNGGVDYLTISGLTVVGAPAHGIWIGQNQSHIRIEKSKIMFNGKGGIFFTRNSQTADPIVSNYPEVIKNYVYGNVLLNWPRGSWDNCAYINGGWPPAITISNGYGLAEGNVVLHNGGEGIIPGDHPGQHIIQDNIVGNNWNMGIYSCSVTSPIVRRNFVFSDAITNPDDALASCLNTGGHPTLFEKAVGHLRQDGIVSADEGGGTALPNYYSGGRFYNNIVLNSRRGFIHYSDNTQSGVKDTQVYNNTIIVPNSYYYDNAGAYAGIRYGNTYGLNADSFVYNNLIVGQHADNYAVFYLNNTSQSTTGITWNNNVYSHATNSTPFFHRGSSLDFSGWKASSLQDNASLFSDPLLTRSDWTGNFTPPSNHPNQCWDVYDYTGVNVSDFMLQSNSPAIGAAVTDPGFSTDFQNLTRSVPWDAGALEYEVSAPDTLSPSAPSGLAVQ